MKHENVNPATGAAAPGFSRGSDKFAHNQWSGHSNDGRLVNKGRGPTKGNDGECHNPGTPGGSVTKDPYRRAPTTGGAQSDTKQYRGQGGTSATGYKNPDRINMNGYSMGDGKMTKGSRPVGPGKTDGINYGPKSQY